MTSQLIKINHFEEITNLNIDDNNIAQMKNSEKIEWRISELANNVIIYLKKNNNPVDNELLSKFIMKLKGIDNQFLQVGKTTAFSTSICTLDILHNNLKINLVSATSGIFQDPFISVLNEMETTSTFKDDFDIAKKLYNFQEKKLFPALQSAKNAEEMAVLEKIVQQCVSLSRKLSSLDTKEHLKKSKEKIKTLWMVKSVQTEQLYIALISYKKGDAGNLSQENRRIKLFNNLSSFITNFNKVSPQISQKDKEAIYNAVCAIHEEFAEHGDEQLANTVIELHKSLELPLPEEKPATNTSQRSTKFETLIVKFDQTPKNESLSLAAKKDNARRSLSEAEIREKHSQRIQKNISNLDPLNPSSKDAIKEIKADIQKLKALSLCKKQDFTHLEEMLDLIKDPSKLKISHNEGRFVNLLIDNFKLTGKQALPSYFAQEIISIKNAQSLIIQALRKANSVNGLLKSAKQVSNELRDKVIKDRFDRFVEQNPTLKTLNLSTYFPALINVFENFTKMSMQELQDKWLGIVNIYDLHSKGQFSKLLKNYSYMDPVKNFEEYIVIAQEDFVKALNLQNPFSDSNLNIYLEQVVDRFKDSTGKWFENSYNTMFSELHLWLVANCERIVIPFNQGDDKDKNLGKGVCYSNSLYRYSLLLDDPKATIQMGSNEKTRYSHKRYSSQHEIAGLGKMTYTAVDDELAKAFELKCYHRYHLSFSNGQDMHQHLVDEMERYAKAGHTQLILALCCPKMGHAVNIQIDYANGMFQMMDDNIGLVKYSSMDEFKKETASYFKTCYPEHNRYSFETFQRS